MALSRSFLPIDLAGDLRLEVEGLTLWTLCGASRHVEGGTLTGMITEGRPRVRMRSGTFDLQAGMWFVAPGEVEVVGGHGLVVQVPGDVGWPQVGGPIEARGRLRYIDGCTDTLLVCPPRLGDPCLNHLHIPAGTRQSAHTHPSLRAGVIARGRGRCVTPDGVIPLRPGQGWYIPTGLQHAFHTDDDSLDVLAWHPDSDFGPTDEDHPMLNRTWLAEPR